MLEKSLGIYYLDYAEKFVHSSLRDTIIGYTKSDLLARIEKRKLQPDWFCWLSECRTPGFLIVGNTLVVEKWINLYMPERFGHPLCNIGV